MVMRLYAERHFISVFLHRVSFFIPTTVNQERRQCENQPTRIFTQTIMTWYELSKQNVLKELDTRMDGLTYEEASDRLKHYGKNQLTEGKRPGALKVFLSQFADLMVIILMVAAVISMFTKDLESTLVIIAVLILNAVLGTVQHMKAEKSLDSLKSLSSPVAKVIRQGQKIEMPSREVVPGDIVILEADRKSVV